MGDASGRSSLSALLATLDEVKQARRTAETRASVLHMAAQYLIGDVQAVIQKYPETAAALEAAIYRYEERTR